MNIGDKISIWFNTLPSLVILIWVLGGGILYATGIVLSKARNCGWLSMSFLGVLMSMTYINAYVYKVGMKDDSIISIVVSLTGVCLLVAMVAWGNGQKVINH